MKTEKWGTSLTGMLLGFLMASGSAGSLLTAFHLPVKDLSAVIAAWGICALLGALILRWKHGGKALVCLLAFSIGYLWRRGTAAQQLWSLVYRISDVYDSAYGWGVLRISDAVQGTAPADLPLGILGCAIALVTVFLVCRRKSGWFAVLCALLPLGLCIVVTDTVPHEIPLLCLMAGSILLLLTGAVRQENEAQGLRLTGMAALPVTLALLALFLLFPRETYVNRSVELQENLLDRVQSFPRLVETGARKLASEFYGTAPRQIDLSQVGPHDPFAYPVLEVTSQQGGTLYLRGQDFDSYSGTGWNSSGQRQEEFSFPGEPADTLSIRTRSRRSLYYLPYYPAEARLLTGGALENPEKEMDYRISVAALPENWRMLTVGGSGETAEDMTSYLALPSATRREAVQMLEGMLSGSNTEKADRIAALVCSSAGYDLNTPSMPDGETDFALWFLRESDRGYCVHFATAATVLLRAADVPARYVTGYMVDTRPGRTVTATEEDAHAWAEYYEPLLGAWVVLEATPSAGLDSPSESREPDVLPVISPEVTLPDDFSKPAPAATQPPAPVLTAPDPVKLTLAARLMILGAAAILILNIQRSTRLTIRRRRQRSGTANEQALTRWREVELLCRLLKETPEEELTALAQKAKFSPHELTPEELLLFDGCSRSCLRRLRTRSWYHQLIYRYIYAIY